MAALSATALGSALFGSAAAAPAPTGWGPDAVPYRSGIVCSSAQGSTALASWRSAATGAPAFALEPITAGPQGAHAAVPAVDATGSSPYRGRDGAVLAALLARQARASTAAANADLAAAVLHVSGLDPLTARCLAGGGSGASARDAAALWAAATRLAGPYTLQLQVGASKLVMGRPTEVLARVTSASGAGVPGVAVDFGTTGPGADLRHGSAITGAFGEARTTVTASTAAAARAVGLVARVRVPGTPVEMSAPGEVSLVAAGAAHSMVRRARVPIDTTADPNLSLTVDRSVVLPGAIVHPALSVTGMRGHAGSARLSVHGPLPLSAATGCGRWAGGAAPSGPAAARTTASASSARFLDVHGDGTVDAAPLTLAKPGCYVLSTDITTSNAIPNVHRVGGRQLVAVAPVHVSVDPAGHGVSTPGKLTAAVRVSGRVPARLGEVRATFAGPARSDDGSCAAVEYPAASATTAVAGHGSARVTSAAVSEPGCYQFRVSGTVHIPHVGSVTLAAPVSASMLVVAPSATVTGLSDGVATDRTATATVTVSGTWTQPGAVRLDLLRLPYNWQGCFGRDWTHAEHVSLDGPAVPTRGDGTYRVSTAQITRSGCWTVVPVLSLRRNPAIRVRDTAPVDPMAAFTTLPPTTADAAHTVALPAPSTSGVDRIITAGALMLGLLIVAVGSTLRMALRDETEQS